MGVPHTYQTMPENALLFRWSSYFPENTFPGVNTSVIRTSWRPPSGRLGIIEYDKGLFHDGSGSTEQAVFQVFDPAVKYMLAISVWSSSCSGME